MVTEPTRKALRKVKRRRKPSEVFVDYVIQIEDWDWSYSLSLNTMRNDPDPYGEYRHLQIIGKLLQPTGMKTDKVEVSLLPSFDMDEERRKDLKPIALGSLEIYPDRIDGHVGIPQDALPPILQMLIAGRFKFVLLRGTKFRYRSARLHSLRMETKLTADDMPAENSAAS